MARDRKRAKQRRAKQERQGARQPAAASRQRAALEPERRSTEIPPEPTEEISGDAELAKEALEGLPTDEVDHPVDDPDAKSGVYPDELDDDEGGGGVLSELVDRDEDLGIDEDPDPKLERAAVEAGGPPRRGGRGGDAAVAERPRREPSARRENRVLAFLRACWAELQRVQWPDRRAVSQATAVVLGFVVIAGSYLGLMDFIWTKVVSALLDL
jgi:preprotein translocase subunit SecE